MIESGWHKKLSVEKRVCKKCKNNIVDDEIHFPYECPSCDDLRNLLETRNPPIDRAGFFKQVFADENAENALLFDSI